MIYKVKNKIYGHDVWMPHVITSMTEQDDQKYI